MLLNSGGVSALACSLSVVRVLILITHNTTQCGFDSRSACIGLISPQSYYTLFSPLSRRCPFQDKHKQKNLCILKTDINLSLLIFPAIRGNHYVIDRHGYPPYFISSFGGWWMSGCMDKSMLILISLWHRLISSRLYFYFFLLICLFTYKIDYILTVY